MKRSQLFITTLVLVALFTAGCASKASNCKQPDVFCVGLVTSSGRVDDRSYNQAVWQGIQQAKANGVVNWTASIETVDARDYEENIQVLADAGYDVIVTEGSALGDATRLEAKTNPNTYFIGVDQDQSTTQEYIPNLVGLVFPEDQIGYLAGAMAAMLTKTGSIGAVCGSDVSPAMQRYAAGFQAGASSIDPKVNVTIVYHNDVGLDKTFSDPEWGAKQANSLIDGGVDIVFGVGGSTGSNALVAAAMRGAYGIGMDTDEYYDLPVAAPHLYASILKMIAPDVLLLIKAARDAQAKTSVFPTANFEGTVGISSYHDLNSSIPDEVKLQISRINAALVSGDISTNVVINNP
jgi:basic membrane protein A and related proteins